jgi:hypothetical protein
MRAVSQANAYTIVLAADIHHAMAANSKNPVPGIIDQAIRKICALSDDDLEFRGRVAIVSHAADDGERINSTIPLEQHQQAALRWAVEFLHALEEDYQVSILANGGGR